MALRDHLDHQAHLGKRQVQRDQPSLPVHPAPRQLQLHQGRRVLPDHLSHLLVHLERQRKEYE